jgi:beta-N-acetylhexosaminidase
MSAGRAPRRRGRPPRTPDPALTRLADAILVPPFPGRTAPSWVLAALERGLAGVTLFGSNVAGPEQLAALTGQLRAAADQPLIAIDEEGGDVTRINHRTGSPYPGNAALGAVGDPALTAAVYRAIGADLAATGINLDFAPTVDVNTAEDNPVIGTRAFGADPALVSSHTAAAVSGLQAAGIAACAKHFPGHGSTREDSHRALAVVRGGLAELRRRDLPPFTAAISAGTRAVMTGHLQVAGLTGSRPATLSHAALTGLLRGELGFSGVIVSDALEMRAVSRTYGVPEGAVLAAAAGADLLCLGAATDEEMYLIVRAALAEAAAERRLPGARLEEAAARAADLRAWLRGQAGAAGGVRTGMAADGNSTAPGGGRDGVGLLAARRAVRADGIDGTAGPPRDALVVEVQPSANAAVGEVPWGLGQWLPGVHGELLRIAGGSLLADADGQAAAVTARAVGRPLVAVVRGAHRDPAAQALVSALIEARPDTVVVEMGLPVWRPPARSYIATYGAGSSNGRAAAELLGWPVTADPATRPGPAPAR